VLIDTFTKTRQAIVRPGYATDRTGSQLYVSWYGREILDLAVGARAVNSAMTTSSRIIWLCSSKPVLLIPLFRAFSDSDISEYEPVANFIPEYANSGKDKVTINHLLTHTVPYCSLGITWDGEKAQAIGERIVMASPWEKAIEAICAMPLTAPPGEAVTYTPATNWMLLAEILERLTGRPHEDTIRAQVLDPLEMAHTSTYVTERTLATLECAPAWDLDGGEPRLDEVDTQPLVFGRWPGLACRGPAHDMAKPIECIAGWRCPEGLNDAWRAKLLHVRRSDLADPTLYGAETLWSLGLCVDPVRFGLPISTRVVGHTGERSSMVFADLEVGITISFLSNGLVPDAADLRRKRSIVRAVYHDLDLPLAGGDAGG
jgi:CubicO group peptidase (beta-lactamase class C family)